MKKLICCLTFFLSSNTFASTLENDSCSGWHGWLRPVCQRFHQIWTEGRDELVVSGYAWHNRFTYRPEKIKTYNEAAWGGGLGRGLIDENGNYQAFWALAFLDSHRNVEPAIGYAYIKNFPISQNIGVGLGAALLITARPDLFKGRPFPGALPWFAINYKKVALGATYIPGAAGAGNVLYIVGKYTF